MYTIKENNESVLLIKNSKFITLIKKIQTIDDIAKYIEESITQYPKATHYCYAYIFNDLKKSSDDGEPGGTAGMPILNVLEKANLTNALCIVIRYFGGIKLGAGGLVRAYSKATKEVLNTTQLVELKKASKIVLSIDYNQNKQFEYLIKNYPIIEKNFQKQITYIISIPVEDLHKFKNYSYQILEDTLIEKNIT